MAVKWDQDSEKLVHGFIHEMEKKMESQTVEFIIPDSIITICLLYFFQFIDEWDTDNVSEKALIVGKFVQNAEGPKGYERFSTFGTHKFNKGIHEWRFKIHELNEINQHFLYFGIATSTKYKDYKFSGHQNDEQSHY